MQLFPSHVGVQGDEEADNRAGKGARASLYQVQTGVQGSDRHLGGAWARENVANMSEEDMSGGSKLQVGWMGTMTVIVTATAAALHAPVTASALQIAPLQPAHSTRDS